MSVSVLVVSSVAGFECHSLPSPRPSVCYPEPSPVLVLVLLLSRSRRPLHPRDLEPRVPRRRLLPSPWQAVSLENSASVVSSKHEVGNQGGKPSSRSRGPLLGRMWCSRSRSGSRDFLRSRSAVCSSLATLLPPTNASPPRVRLEYCMGGAWPVSCCAGSLRRGCSCPQAP